MTVSEAILTLNANVVIACERAGFSSATVKMIEDALDTIEDALKAQEPEPTKFQIKTTISNVDIPKDIDEEQFMAVLSQQYAALARLYGDDVPTYNPS